MKGPQLFDEGSNPSGSIVGKERNVAWSASQLWKLVLVGSNPAAPTFSLSFSNDMQKLFLEIFFNVLNNLPP